MNAIKRGYLAAKQKSVRAAHVVAGVALAAPVAVFAQTSTDPGVEAITSLGDSAKAYITAGFGLLTIVVAGFWGMSMYKKVAGKGK